MCVDQQVRSLCWPNVAFTCAARVKVVTWATTGTVVCSCRKYFGMVEVTTKNRKRKNMFSIRSVKERTMPISSS